MERIRPGLIAALWWKLLPGPSVLVPWPVTPDCADPNELYRPWLEQNVGVQGWDWNWKPQLIYATDKPFPAEDALLIKVRKKHAKQITAIALMWQ